MKHLLLLLMVLGCAGESIKGDKGDPGEPAPIVKQTPVVSSGIVPVAAVFNDGSEGPVSETKLVNVEKVERDPQTNEFIYTLTNPMKTSYNYGVVCSLNGGGTLYPPVIIGRPLGEKTFAVKTWVPSFGNVSIAHSCLIFETE